MTDEPKGRILVGPVTELEEKRCRVVTGAGHTMAVFRHDGRIYAVDNRCPHMGFPLERGTVKDALEDNVRLVIAKSVLGLHAAEADYRIPLRLGAEFGTTYSDQGWGQAMSILTCAANIPPHLHDDDRSRALYQGLLHVSRDCVGRPPRFLVGPLSGGEDRPEVLKRWFRSFLEVRDDHHANDIHARGERHARKPGEPTCADHEIEGGDSGGQDLHPGLAWLRFREILFHDLQNVRPATPLDDNTLVLHARPPIPRSLAEMLRCSTLGQLIRNERLENTARQNDVAKETESPKRWA